LDNEEKAEADALLATANASLLDYSEALSDNNDLKGEADAAYSGANDAMSEYENNNGPIEIAQAWANALLTKATAWYDDLDNVECYADLTIPDFNALDNYVLANVGD